MTSPTALFRVLGLVLLTSLPALAQSVTATVTAATQLIVTAGTNTNTRPAGTDLGAGLDLGATYQSGPIFVTVNSVFGFSATSNSITHTIQESMTGVNATRSAGPHATRLQLTASQPVTGTLIVQYSPGTIAGGSSNASIDIGDNGSVEWTRAPGTSPQTWTQQVTVDGTLSIRVSTAMVQTTHSISVQFRNWLPHLPLVGNGFENGLTGWQTFGNVVAPAAAPPAVEPRNGIGLCKMFGSFTGGFNVSGAFQKFTASPGDTFALDCHARHWSGDPLIGAGQAANRAVKKIVFLDDSGIEIGAGEELALDGTMPTDAWLHTPTVVATAPPGTTGVQAMLLFLQPANDGGAALFDDVSFARIDGCGAFTLPVEGTPGPDLKPGGYFTLDVTTPHGVRLCGIDLQPWAAAGTAVDATVYLHRSLTDAAQLDGSQADAANWCPIATLHGVSNGLGVTTSFAITNATNSLQLPPGQYLLAVGNPGVGFRFVPGSSITVADPGSNLAMRTGGSVFVGSSGLGYFWLWQPGYLPGALHYEILSAPTTPTTCAAEGVAVGTGCGGEPNMVYEVFAGGNAWDLGSSDVIVTGNGSGASLSTAPATALVPPVGPPVAMGGGVSASFPLGFDLGAFGLPNASDLAVGLNGSIFFGGVGNPALPDTATAAGSMSNDSVARLAAALGAWLPGTGGDVYVEVTSAVQAIVTLDLYDVTNDLYYNLQVVITPTSMRVRYHPVNHPFAGLVGFHNGVPLPAPPSVGRVDLTAGPSPFTNPNARADLHLSAQNRPLLGTNFDVTLDHNPLIAAVYLDINPVGAGVPLPTPLFAPACNLYVGLNAAAWSVTVAPASTTSIPIPLDTGILGLAFGMQGIGLLPDTLIASNGLGGLVGGF